MNEEETCALRAFVGFVRQIFGKYKIVKLKIGHE